jgi:hypothetical protein
LGVGFDESREIIRRSHIINTNLATTFENYGDTIMTLFDTRDGWDCGREGRGDEVAVDAFDTDYLTGDET